MSLGSGSIQGGVSNRFTEWRPSHVLAQSGSWGEAAIGELVVKRCLSMRLVIVTCFATVLLPLLLLCGVSTASTRCGLFQPLFGSVGVNQYFLHGPGGEYGFYTIGYGWGSKVNGIGCAMVLADKEYNLPVSLGWAAAIAFGAATAPWGFAWLLAQHRGAHK
jgi:hypothetical protein